MANEEHLAILRQGVVAWNKWRKESPDIQPDLIEVNLRGANLRGANLRGADLRGANLREVDLSGANLSGSNLSGALLFKADLSGANLVRADLREVNLRGAHLSGAILIEPYLIVADLSGANLSRANLVEVNFRWAHLSGADLSGAHLSEADLRKADLSGANLSGADLSGANLSGADLSRAHLGGASLQRAILIETNLEKADLTNCSIYGVSAWGLELEGTIQSNLIITPPDEPTITVDNLEVAQFIYLLLNNERIRDVIDTITTKVVLILGRFTPERKAVLDTIRDELRKRNYLPVVFDFDPSASRDLTETVSTLAHMSRFIIADISEPKSIPQELQAIVPNLPSVAVRPIIVRGEREYGMFEHFKRYPWVLPVYEYADTPQLLASLLEQVISPAEAKVKELRSASGGQAESTETTE